MLALACSPDPASSSGAVEPASALRGAAGRGDAPAVRALLEQGAPVDARDGQGATALVRAAYGNHLDGAALLVQAGADVDLADDSRQSAYLIATSEVGDDPRLLELTLAAGADINAKDSYDGTGLIRAAERAHVTIVERLLQAGDRPRPHQPSGLHGSARGRRLRGGRDPPTATVAALVAGGVDLDIPDGGGETALAHAERGGQREVASILRAAGAGG